MTLENKQYIIYMIVIVLVIVIVCVFINVYGTEKLINNPVTKYFHKIIDPCANKHNKNWTYKSFDVDMPISTPIGELKIKEGTCFCKNNKIDEYEFVLAEDSEVNILGDKYLAKADRRVSIDNDDFKWYYITLADEATISIGERVFNLHDGDSISFSDKEIHSIYFTKPHPLYLYELNSILKIDNINFDEENIERIEIADETEINLFDMKLTLKKNAKIDFHNNECNDTRNIYLRKNNYLNVNGFDNKFLTDEIWIDQNDYISSIHLSEKINISKYGYDFKLDKGSELNFTDGKLSGIRFKNPKDYYLEDLYHKSLSVKEILFIDGYISEYYLDKELEYNHKDLGTICIYYAKYDRNGKLSEVKERTYEDAFNFRKKLYIHIQFIR